MQKQITDLVEKLTDLHNKISEFDDLKDRTSRLLAVSDATEKRLVSARAELADINAKLTKQEAIRKKKMEEDLHHAQGELRDTLAMLETAKQELTIVQNDIAAGQKRHAELIKTIRGVEKQVA